MNDYELYHASTRKHKYIKKIGNRYFYTQQEIAAYLKEKGHPVEFSKIKDFSKGDVRPGPDGKPQGGKTIGGRMYYDKTKNGYNKSVGVLANNGKVTLQTTDKDHTMDLSKTKKGLDKKRKQVRDVKEAVAEATGRRDVYFEAKKVTENGRTYYDDDNAQLRTGKKDKRGRVDPEDGSVYTKKGTMQYDNEYTRELNEQTRKRGRKKLKKMATRPINNLKKQSDKGKKRIERALRPKKATVTIEDRIDNRTGEHF